MIQKERGEKPILQTKSRTTTTSGSWTPPGWTTRAFLSTSDSAEDPHTTVETMKKSLGAHLRTFGYHRPAIMPSPKNWSSAILTCCLRVPSRFSRIAVSTHIRGHFPSTRAHAPASSAQAHQQLASSSTSAVVYTRPVLVL